MIQSDKASVELTRLKDAKPWTRKGEHGIVAGLLRLRYESSDMGPHPLAL